MEKIWYNGKNGMPERKHGKVEPHRTIGVNAADIVVARNRSAEPYIKSFKVAPENLAQESLGTIVGVFSVSERSESSAYVVNVLASVAKKEYFANPRRGSLESFEATLHKMNVALAELVKNGQTQWIGNLHGAIAVFEKHTLHFSVTGEGSILLFRGGSLSDIGEGLASEEAKLHPLKTFVEISSGRLAPEDYVILSSPELFALFSLEELERSARRIGVGKRFSQFLETAMVNELKTGAVVILDVFEKLVEEAPEPKPSRRHTEKPRVINAWSARTFEAKKSENSSYFHEESPEPALPIDLPSTDQAPFGDIYVRGEASGEQDEHPLVTKGRWILEDALTHYSTTKTRFKEQVKRQGAALSSLVSAGTSSSIKKIHRKVSSLRVRAASARLPKTEKHPPTEGAVPSTKPPLIAKIPRITLPKFTVPALPQAKISRYAEFSKRHATQCAQEIARIVKTISSRFVLPSLRTAVSFMGSAGVSLKRGFSALPPKRQLLVASSATFVLTIGILLAWNQNTKEPSDPVPVVVTAPPKPAFPPEGEKNAELAEPEAIPGTGQEIMTPVFLDDRLFLVTKEAIVDTANNASYQTPSDSTVRYATSMNDLDLIFLLLENGELYSFAPANRAFVKNTAPLPSGFKTAGIGSFLTYLYFLEEGTGNIYRYPRAEGGFGAGVRWTRDSLPPETTSIAVSEAIYASHGSSVAAFFQGRKAPRFSLEAPKTSLSVTDLCANPEAPTRFGVVDAAAKRLIVFSDAGAIVRQYFSDRFENATACSIKNDGGSVAVSAGMSTFLIRLTENGQ